MRDIYKRVIHSNILECKIEYIAVYRNLENELFFHGKKFENIVEPIYENIEDGELIEIIHSYIAYRLYLEDGLNRFYEGYKPLEKELIYLNKVFKLNMLNDSGLKRLETVKGILSNGIEEYYGTEDYSNFYNYVDYSYDIKALENSKDKSFDAYYSEMCSNREKRIVNITFHNTVYDVLCAYCTNEKML